MVKCLNIGKLIYRSISSTERLNFDFKFSTLRSAVECSFGHNFLCVSANGMIFGDASYFLTHILGKCFEIFPKLNNASKPMLLLILDMPKTVIKVQKYPVHDHFLYWKYVILCIFSPKSVTSFMNLAIKE